MVVASCVQTASDSDSLSKPLAALHPPPGTHRRGERWRRVQLQPQKPTTVSQPQASCSTPTPTIPSLVKTWKLKQRRRQRQQQEITFNWFRLCIWDCELYDTSLYMQYVLCKLDSTLGKYLYFPPGISTSLFLPINKLDRDFTLKNVDAKLC